MTDTIKATIITGIFTLLSAFLTFIMTYLINKESEKQKRAIARKEYLLNQIKAFYNLEKLYIEEVYKLRNEIPETEGSKALDGIKKEFRRKNEDVVGTTIEMTALEADKELSRV